MIWFTSDTHWHHANIIKYTKRPFANVDEMNEAMINNWNARVGRNDNVYHLGDFAFATEPQIRELNRRLNGHVHLIEGNHDSKRIKGNLGFASYQPYKELKLASNKIILFHYAMRVWNGSHHGSWHLYGHSHGTLPEDPYSRSTDIGVDSHNYAPVSLDEVAIIMGKKKFRPVDHHREDRR